MEKVLVVEDTPTWQEIHKSRLERLLGVDSVDIADNYDVALSMLTQSYAAYIVDGEFPRSQGGKAGPLGIQFAREIHQRENSYDKVFLVSGNPDVLKDAQTKGITKVYTKGSADADEGIGDLTNLMNDLRSLLVK